MRGGGRCGWGRWRGRPWRVAGIGWAVARARRTSSGRGRGAAAGVAGCHPPAFAANRRILEHRRRGGASPFCMNSTFDQDRDGWPKAPIVKAHGVAPSSIRAPENIPRRLVDVGQSTDAPFPRTLNERWHYATFLHLYACRLFGGSGARAARSEAPRRREHCGSSPGGRR